MGLPPHGDYFRGSARLHAIGILGGVIWMIALSFNVIASSVAGPAVSYALGQGATLVAAIWGLFIWREFRAAPAGTNKYLGLGRAAVPPPRTSTIRPSGTARANCAMSTSTARNSRDTRSGSTIREAEGHGAS